MADESNSSDNKTKISRKESSQNEKETEEYQNQKYCRDSMLHPHSAPTSRRASFLVGEETVTIIGPDEAEITLDDIVVAPDGGWGWVVVFAAFMSNLMVDGITFSFGIMQDEIVKSSSPNEHDRIPVSTVAWVGSLLFGFTLLSGPIVSSLANKFGFRASAMAGSIISSACFAIAWASTNKETGEANMVVMFIVYGIIGGIGFSLIFVPAVITVGFYFEKKRALATGIAICGSGCGTFVFAPFSAYLIKEFGWENALLVQAGLLFCCLSFASLYRPLLPPNQIENQRQYDVEKRGSEPAHTPLLLRIKRIRDQEREKWNSSNSIDGEYELTDRLKMSSSPSPKLVQNSHDPRKISLPATLQPQIVQVPNNRLSLHEIEEEADHEQDEKTLERRNQDSEIGVRRTTGESRRSRKISFNEPSFRKRRTSVTLMLSNSAIITTAEMSQSKILRIPNKSVLNKPLNRDDIFLAGSLQAVPEYSISRTSLNARAVLSVKTQVDMGSEADENEVKESKWNFEILEKMLDFSLISSPTFLLLAISGFITILGFPIPFIYLKALAEANQVDENKATLLVSIIGITNTIGRIVCGGIADSPKVNSLIINNAATTVGGIATAIVPLIGALGFPGYVVYSCIFGFSMACFASLRSILLVELLGLSKLTNAFGLLLLFQGVAALCGSPLAGLLFDLTGTYDMSFYVAGSLMLFSGVICYPLSAINNWECKRNTNVTESENENEYNEICCN